MVTFIIDDQRIHSVRLAESIKKQDKPPLYWLPKLHESPYITCVIATLCKGISKN